MSTFYIIAKVEGDRKHAGNIRRAMHKAAVSGDVNLADNLIGNDRTHDTALFKLCQSAHTRIMKGQQ